jgi:hypothetical protein
MDQKNARQCKERWTNYLSPGINTAAWTRDEEALLIQKYAEFGPRWVAITKFFPNRTDSMLKNRFNRLRRVGQKARHLLADDSIAPVFRPVPASTPHLPFLTHYTLDEFEPSLDVLKIPSEDADFAGWSEPLPFDTMYFI